MAHVGYLTSEMATALCAEPLGILPLHQRATRPQHAARQILDEATALLAGTKGPIDGCIIQTGIDLGLQQTAKQAIDRVLGEVEQSQGYAHPTHGQTSTPLADGRAATSYLQAAVVVIDNQTGNIVAQLGGRDLNDSQFDRCARGRRPPGAAFLPFVYAAAFESPNLSPSSLVIDAPINNRQVMIGGSIGVLGEWSAGPTGNAYEGEVAPGYALLSSKNAATVRFGSAAGLDRVIQLAEAAGIRSKLRQYPATFLGSSEVSLLELTRAYTIFPALGRRPAVPNLVEKITMAKGGVLYQRPEVRITQALSSMTAAQISAILSTSLDSGEARSRYGLQLRHAAGQSGTAYQFTDSWFVGFNAHYTCGVWVGFDLPRRIYPDADSREIALPIWVAIMNALPGEDNPLPSVQAGIVQLCLHSGQRAANSCRKLHPTLICEMPMAPSEKERLQSCQFHGDAPHLPLPSGPLEVHVTRAVPVIPKSPVVVGPNPYVRPLRGRRSP